MQCVILAAGKGVRMHPLTLDTPKPLLKFNDSTILDRIVEALPADIDELILVVGYRKEQIREHCGDHFHGRPVIYAEQDEPRGTADALIRCKDMLKGKFLLLNGDDLHGKNSLERACTYDLALLAAPSEHPERFGVVSLKSDGTLDTIIEKPADPPTNLVSTGAFVLDKRIFSYTPPQAANGEYFLPDMVTQLAKEYPVAVIEQDFWLPLGYPEDLANAEKLLAGNKH
jgi:NDP-sugar pyrophosphorylase family protein